jgi:hypothetical protein
MRCIHDSMTVADTFVSQGNSNLTTRKATRDIWPCKTSILILAHDRSPDHPTQRNFGLDKSQQSIYLTITTLSNYPFNQTGQQQPTPDSVTTTILSKSEQSENAPVQWAS